MSDRIREKVTRSLFWTSINQVLSTVIGFCTTIVLVRLLDPKDFGLMGMAAMFGGLISMFADLGFNAAIIQRKNISQKHLSSSFWSGIGISIVLCLLTIGAAPIMAAFFKNSTIKPMMIILSFGFIIGSFKMVQSALLTKELEFKKIAIITVSSIIVNSFTVITLALLGFEVWSLVWGSIVSGIWAVIITWVIKKWRPSFLFNYSSFKELFGFGANVIGSRFFLYINTNMPNLIIGKILGASPLGYYSLSYDLVTSPLRKVQSIISRITFPTFSQIQDDDERLRMYYLITVQYISLITFPSLVGLMVVAPEFVRVVFGVKWSPAIFPLQSLCIFGMLRSIVTMVGSIILAKGRPDIEFKWSIFTFIPRTLILFVGSFYGLNGVAISLCLYMLLSIPILQWIAIRLINLRYTKFVKVLMPASVNSLIMLLFLIFIRYNLNYTDIKEWGRLLILITSGIIIYIVTSLVRNRTVYMNFYNFIKEVFFHF